MAVLTLQPDDTTGIDNYLMDDNGSSRDTNCSTETIIAVGEAKGGTNCYWRGLIKFDLSSIPAGSTITSAVMTLTLNSAGGTDATNNRTMSVYRVLRAWAEATSDWNHYTGTTSWGTIGCANTTTDREAAAIGTCDFATTDSAGDAKVFTLTSSKIQEMITGGVFTNNGFLLQVATELNDAYYIASSAHATASSRPLLVITYEVPKRGGFLPFLI